MYVFAEAHRVYGDGAFRDAALRAAETTWQFGLLKKGPGLCHGISGNGRAGRVDRSSTRVEESPSRYSLLAAFKLTRDPKWLHRAAVFAQCLTNADLRRRSRTPDHPLSLFEGDAGAACFLRDLREDPLRAEFPLFEIDDSDT